MLTPKIQIPSEFKRLLDDDWREASVWGGRYSLKSHTVARILLIKAMEAKRRFGLFREFQNSIADSSYQLVVDLINLYKLNSAFNITRDAIICKNGSDFLFKGLHNNTQNIKSIEGIDYAWVEEAQTVIKDSIETLVPTVRKKGSKIIWTYNRLTDLDPIYKRLVIEGRPDTLLINVNYDVAEKYGWLEDATKKEIEWDKENNPDLYTHKWLGQPISQTEYSIIPRDKILEAMQREITDDGAIIIGVDVARMGSDRTVITKRKGLKVLNIRVLEKARTNEVADVVKQEADFDNSVEIRVDDTGVGGGVTDDLLKDGYNTVAINFGGEPMDKDKYPNWISEAWFYMAGIIDKVQLPMNQDLLMELSTREWKQDEKGKRKVEGKQAYKKRGYRSPDYADSLIICFKGDIGAFNADTDFSFLDDDEIDDDEDILDDELD